MTDINILSGFKDREKNLRKILRYSLYPVVFYRSSVWSHSKRVFWMIKEIIPFAKKNFGEKFDGEKAQILALIHDDPEIIIGDYQMGNKDKMTEQELENIKEKEKKSISILVKKFPKKVNGFEYKDLLMEMFIVNTLESKLVKYYDKLDAHLEALHEIYAGNTTLAVNVVNQYGKIDTPFDYYIKYFNNFVNYYPEFDKLFKTNFDLLKRTERIDYQERVKVGHSHTKESLKNKKGYPQYDAWIEMILRINDKEEIKNLYYQKEFFN